MSLSQRPNLSVSHHRHLIVALSHPRALAAVGNKTSTLVVEQVKWQQPLGQREIRDRIGHHLGVHLTWLWKTMGLFLYLGCLLRNMVGFDCDWRMLAMACFWRPRPPDSCCMAIASRDLRANSNRQWTRMPRIATLSCNIGVA